MKRAIIDGGAIFAMVVANDRHHEPAKRFLGEWLEAAGTFVLIDLVFTEAMTLLKSRLGRSDIACQVGRELRDNPAYTWLTIDVDLERDIWATFERFSDKDWSYTDCALMAAGRRLRVAHVFSFDHHIDQMPGIERLP